MNKKVKVIDEGDPRRYYTMIPNMVDDLKLSAFAFRLYVHLKRVAGEDGKCWQSTRTLAEACNMGIMTVSRAKKELIENRLIAISSQKTEHGGYDSHIITITDIWLNNSQKYQVSARDLQVPDRYLQVPQENLQVPVEILKNNPLRITVLNEENKFSSLAEKTYFEIHHRKRWANDIQKQLFYKLVHDYGEDQLINAVKWAAVKNISDLTKIEAACKTMSKNGRKPAAQETKINSDGSVNI